MQKLEDPHYRQLERRLYRPSEAWHLIGVGPTKFWALVKSGALKTHKIGRATVIPAESIDAFIKSVVAG